MALASIQKEIIIERDFLGRNVTARELSYWDKIVLHNAHPAKMLFNGMAVMWAIYYAWYQEGALAVVAGVGFLIIGSVIVRLENASKFVETARGQMLLAMSNPISAVLDLMGFALLFYSVWNHVGVLTLCAISTLAVSRTWAAVKAFGR